MRVTINECSNQWVKQSMRVTINECSNLSVTINACNNQ